MSGKFRKVFDNKYVVIADDIINQKQGRIEFLNLKDTLPKSYKKVVLLQLVYPTTGWPEETRAWYIMEEYTFNNFSLDNPTLIGDEWFFNYSYEDIIHDMKTDFTKHLYYNI